MISLPQVALRNVLRNGRRSMSTMLSIMLSAITILTFGSFMRYVVLSYQTSTVERVGHLALYQKGYNAFGAGDPSAYGIPNYQRVVDTLRADPQLSRLTQVVTETQAVFGVAGYYPAGTSRTFMGDGVVPADRATMQRWNAYKIPEFDVRRSAVRSDDPESGVIGTGLATILQMCAPLDLRWCAAPPPKVQPVAADESQFESLRALDAPVTMAAGGAKPRIDLLAATASGAPNVVSLNVERAEFQGVKEIDDAYVAMTLPLAQKLVYGRGEPRVTSIVLQLNDTADLARAKKRVLQIIRQAGLSLEMRDFTQIAPLYAQTTSFLSVIFGFVASILGTIVLFTVVNTLQMTVVERTNEIGTLRALGVQRGGVRNLFLAEGLILGLAGATLGLVVASLLAFAINASGLTWTPPGAAGRVPFRLYFFEFPQLLFGVWIGLVAIVTLASVRPANRAARMEVVDALRHV
jgi:putative ABC transport system permease protein